MQQKTGKQIWNTKTSILHYFFNRPFSSFQQLKYFSLFCFIFKNLTAFHAIILWVHLTFSKTYHQHRNIFLHKRISNTDWKKFFPIPTLPQNNNFCPFFWIPQNPPYSGVHIWRRVRFVTVCKRIIKLPLPRFAAQILGMKLSTGAILSKNGYPLSLH